jgi:glycolate oxidase iron-sulfur subunit
MREAAGTRVARAGRESMQTIFTAKQLADPDVASSAAIVRRCVHCGFCTATCPTYVLLGDELDSPRGRIYLIKDMLEHDKPASAQVVKHIDRCLSCLACMTTCPSDVHYMHLVDHARRHIEATYARPLPDRLVRSLLAIVLPRPWLFRLALLGARFGRPFARRLPGPLGAMLGLAPAGIASPSPVDRPQVFQAEGPKRARVALLSGCAQQVLAPEINEATIRLLTRHGVEVVVAKGAGCCGALTHHMGKERPALRDARANIDAWWRELEGAGLDAVVINASGCGTTVKDYGFMLREDPAYAAKAARISAITRDITELMREIGLKPPVREVDLVVAYHSACSMQHGQQIQIEPKQLLSEAGFTVKDVPEAHLCCGSAGTYNILQPAIATQLRERKVENIERVRPDLIATGNIGCITQIAAGTRIPIVHTAALLDWATGGPLPKPLEGVVEARAEATQAAMPEAAD